MRTPIVTAEDMPAAPRRERYAVDMAPVDHSELCRYAVEHDQDVAWAIRRAVRYLLDGEAAQERRMGYAAKKPPSKE